MEYMPENIVATLDAIQPDNLGSEAERFAAKEAARRLLARLETPFERGWATAWEAPNLISSLQVVQDLGIWNQWSREGGVKTHKELMGWAKTSCEPNLLRRLLRHIAAAHVLEEVGVDTWKPTPFSIALGVPETHCGDIIKAGLDWGVPGAQNLPKFLAKNSYREPLDIASFDNCRDIFGADFFTFCQTTPEGGASFQGVMTALTQYKMNWTDVYDATQLVSGADLEKPVLVDVGGAQGLDCQRLLTKYPHLPADSLIVQDLPEVITNQATEKLDGKIRKMIHDFFQPQPIEGARAYFLHAVPHDWPDADVSRIFTSLKKAMTKGYSKLLICEIVLPAEKASYLMSTLDLALMSCVSGTERTEEAWQRLLTENGFKILSISRDPGSVESVIEAELE